MTYEQVIKRDKLLSKANLQHGLQTLGATSCQVTPEMTVLTSPNVDTSQGASLARLQRYAAADVCNELDVSGWQVRPADDLLTNSNGAYTLYLHPVIRG